MRFHNIILKHFHIKRLSKWGNRWSNQKNKDLDLNYHWSRSTLLGIMVKSGFALFMKEGVTWKFPFFLYHFRAASWMKESGFKHWSHWKIYQPWQLEIHLGSDNHIWYALESISVVLKGEIGYLYIRGRGKRQWATSSQN